MIKMFFEMLGALIATGFLIALTIGLIVGLDYWINYLFKLVE